MAPLHSAKRRQAVGVRRVRTRRKSSRLPLCSCTESGAKVGFTGSSPASSAVAIAVGPASSRTSSSASCARRRLFSTLGMRRAARPDAAPLGRGWSPAVTGSTCSSNAPLARQEVCV